MTFGIRRADSINGSQSLCGFFGVYPGSDRSIGDDLAFGRIAGREAA